ncbi:MAG: DUF2079 domain-containing protein [Actinobacteria bacterium]|nr:DUF2079 domain-containing protein [Actinomycetota bacterium]
MYVLFWLAVSFLLSQHSGQGLGKMSQRTAVWFSASMMPLLTYYPYLIYRTGVSGDTVELSPLAPRPSVILLLLWSLALLAVLLRMTIGKPASSMLSRFTRRPAVTLAVMICAWIAAFFILDLLKDQYMHVTTINSAVYREAMLDVTDPRGFMFSHLALSEGSSIFGAHMNVILIFILPIFRLFPDYRMLLLISDVALGLAAIPVYLLARRHFSTALSLLFAAMFLMVPIIAAQPGRSDFSELRFFPLLFLTTFYFFETRRFWWFTATALLLLTIREDMGLFVAIFGVYALMRRYPLKWIFAPLIAGSTWFLLSVLVLLPHLSPTGTAVRSTVRYSALGSSGSEIAKTILFRPWKLLPVALSTSSHIGAVFGLLISSGMGIAFFSGAIIFALPAVAELLFQQTTNLINFMAVPAAATLIVSFLYGLSRIDRIFHSFWKVEPGRTAAVLGVFMFFLALAPFHTWFNPDLYRPRYNYEAAREAFGMIPDDARVRLPEFMLAYAKPEQTLSGFHQATYQEDLEGGFIIKDDYIIIDRRIPARTGDDRYYNGLEDVTDFLITSPDFRIMYEQDDIALYVRNGYEPVTANENR